MISRGNSSKRYFFTFSGNRVKQPLKRTKIALFLVWCVEEPQLSLNGWNAWHDQTGQHDGLVSVLVVNGWLEVSVHDDWCWHFKSLVCESQTCFFIRQIILITIIYQFAICLYFMVLDSSILSKEVVTEPISYFSRCISIFRITLTKDAMFEIAQVLDI